MDPSWSALSAPIPRPHNLLNINHAYPETFLKKLRNFFGAGSRTIVSLFLTVNLKQFISNTEADMTFLYTSLMFAKCAQNLIERTISASHCQPTVRSFKDFSSCRRECHDFSSEKAITLWLLAKYLTGTKWGNGLTTCERMQLVVLELLKVICQMALLHICMVRKRF